MKTLPSLTLGVCLLALSAGVAFADNLHKLVPSPNPNPGAATAAPGQTGSNVLSSCGPTMGFPSLGNGALPGNFDLGKGINPAGTNGSPFNQSVSKRYAGNPNNPTTAPGHPSSPNAVSQYDNACAQQAQHQLH
jgi:hypothetical protein